MKMNDQIDEGPILAQQDIEIKNTTDGKQLIDQISYESCSLLFNTLKKYFLGKVSLKEQDHSLSTYAKKINKTETQVDWGLSANIIEKKIRAFYPSPAMWFKHKGQRYKILKAKISNKVKIGPFCYIGPNVILNENVELVSNVHIEGNTTIGNGTRIFPFASLGTQPQDLKFKNEKNSLDIGKNNLIREYVTINPGTVGGGSKTVIGNNCLFMISSHIAHDCQVGNNVIIANNVPLGGHSIIEDNVVIGGNSAVQQFTRIGKMAMIGGMTGVLHDVIPYGLSTGNRNSLQGLNLIGLRRAKFENKDILGLSEAYKEIFATKNINENIGKLNGSFQENPLVKNVINFITKDKKRSICTPFS